jgi:ATP-dependent RNA helicase DDX23/PRP28
LNFEPQLIKILDAMPSSNLRPENPELVDDKKVYRQTTMFSATMPIKVEALAKKYLRHPVIIQIGDRGQARAAATVVQRVEMTTEGRKKQRLLEILHNEEGPFIVFCNSKKACDALARTIENDGLSVTVLHSGKVQDQREENLEAYKKGLVDVLVATDVVGRGIDISGVMQVVNYDMPSDIEKYTHRIGRTGRAGREGLATSFVTDADTAIYFDLKQMLESAGQEVPAELARHEASKQKPGGVVDKPKRQNIIYAK